MSPIYSFKFGHVGYKEDRIVQAKESNVVDKLPIEIEDNQDKGSLDITVELEIVQADVKRVTNPERYGLIPCQLATSSSKLCHRLSHSQLEKLTYIQVN